jgi:transcriptional regulator GlxA family with amidase domain
MIDFAGPWEVFQDTGGAGVPGFSLYTVAGGSGPYQTSGTMAGDRMTGLKFSADYRFANAPQPRVVMMGAQAGRDDPAKLAWVRKVAQKADIVMSVCTGAFILAGTGLIDGLSATTHHDFYDSFAATFPKVKLVRGTRFVDNGKYISAGGLTSGIDAALHVVRRYYGAGTAQRVADYMEYQSSGWKA